MKTNMDFIGKGTSSGEVAGRLTANGQLDIGAMRPYIGKDGKVYATVYTGGNPQDAKSYKQIQINAAGTLRRDEWKALDQAVIKVAEQRLSGIEDLRSKGLIYNLGNAMGTTVLEHHTISDAMEASLTMDGITRSKGDRVTYNTHYTPIPIIHVDYEINMRVLSASRSLGNPLDTSNAERAARKVVEKLEEMLFTDTDYTFGGGTIYSYLNYPDRNTISLGTNWDASGKTGAQIIQDVLAMKQASIDAYHYGPWMLYVPTSYDTVLDEDYSVSGASGQTIKDRIKRIAGILDVKVVDKLPANNVLLVQMTSDVVRLISGMGLQNIQWNVQGNMLTKYKVMTIQVPQIRSDDNGRTGIVHLA